VKNDHTKYEMSEPKLFGYRNTWSTDRWILGLSYETVKMSPGDRKKR
jgi:hypothetical protein